MTPAEYRLRVCFGKTGRLRYLSHLELTRALERMVRRSGLPYAVTQGFSPHIKLAFSPALPVGTSGEREYVDVWLTRYTEPLKALSSLAKAAAPDLVPREAAYVSERAPALTAALTIAKYAVDLKGGRTDSTLVQAALSKLLSTGRLETEHRGKTKVFDLTRSVPEDPCVEDVSGGVRISLTIRMGPQGSLRPETLVKAIQTDTALEATAVHTTRLDLLTEDEKGAWSRPV